MTREQQVALWDAINAYASACGGNTSKRVHGNTITRQKAVVEVERIVRQIETEAACALPIEADKPPGQHRAWCKTPTREMP